MQNLEELPREQLVAVVKQLLKENKELKQELKDYQKELEKLLKQLRKYDNENTPSGSIPPFMRSSVQIRRYEIKDEKEEDKGKTVNIRNERPEKIHRKERLKLECCPNCGSKKLRRKKAVNHRTVVKIILPEVENVKYAIPEYYCGKCKTEVRPKVPDALPNSKFDLFTVLLISVLSVGANISVDQISSLFKTIFGISISPASVSNNLKKLKDYLGDEYEKIEEEIRKARVNFRDETSSRKNGATNWLWAVTTAKAACYRIEKTRQHINAKKLPYNPDGVSISDGYKAYNEISKRMQRCWAHLCRIADKPEHYFHSEEEMQDYWQFVEDLKMLFHNSKEDKKGKGVSFQLMQEYEDKLMELMKSVKHLGKNADKVMNYIMSYWGEWFTFLEIEEAEPTNNRAERVLRHAVLKRRISQQHRSTASQKSYAMQLSLYMTSRLKGENYIENLRNAVESKLYEMEKF
jgi:transposase